VRRRTFIAVLGGAAVWPLAARAQQPGQTRRIGMLWIIAETDPQAIKNREAFLKQLHQLGWRVGENVYIDHRTEADDACETEEAFAFVDDVFGMMKSDLMGLPAMVTRDLNIRRDIEKAVSLILNNTAARLDERAKTLKPNGSEPPAEFLNQTPGH
jgi:hypothetical protein